MRQVVNRLYTFQLRLGEPEFQAVVDRWLGATRKWDEPRHTMDSMADTTDRGS